MSVVLPVLNRQAVYRKKTLNQEGQLRKKVQLDQLELCPDIVVLLKSVQSKVVKMTEILILYVENLYVCFTYNNCLTTVERVGA